MSLQGEKTHALFEKAKKSIPYGVNSNFRYWGEDTMVIQRQKGHGFGCRWQEIY